MQIDRNKSVRGVVILGQPNQRLLVQLCTSHGYIVDGVGLRECTSGVQPVRRLSAVIADGTPRAKISR